jgi:hypothetical protein
MKTISKMVNNEQDIYYRFQRLFIHFRSTDNALKFKKLWKLRNRLINK